MVKKRDGGGDSDMSSLLENTGPSQQCWGSLAPLVEDSPTPVRPAEQQQVPFLFLDFDIFFSPLVCAAPAHADPLPGPAARPSDPWLAEGPRLHRTARADAGVRASRRPTSAVPSSDQVYCNVLLQRLLHPAGTGSLVGPGMVGSTTRVTFKYPGGSRVEPTSLWAQRQEQEGAFGGGPRGHGWSSRAWLSIRQPPGS